MAELIVQLNLSPVERLQRPAVVLAVAVQRDPQSFYLFLRDCPHLRMLIRYGYGYDSSLSDEMERLECEGTNLAEDAPDDLLSARWGGGGAGVPVVLAGVSLDVLRVEDPQRNVRFFMLAAALLSQLSQLFIDLQITAKVM